MPDLAALPADLWTVPGRLPGVDLCLEAGLRRLEDELAPHIVQYAPPADAPGTEHGYHTANPMYGALDGEVLYAMLRSLRPARVLELGAGWSSLVVADAAVRNAAEGHPLAHVCADPAPSALLGRISDRAEILPVGSREVPPERFSTLGAGDVLFIDTTHAVRPGGDVVHLLLEVVPALPAGVIVHVHDFFRPFEYPRELYETLGAVWQEHHVLQALLVDNPRLEVLMANHALWRLHPERVRAVVASLTGAEQPSALWLRVR